MAKAAAPYLHPRLHRASEVANIPESRTITRIAKASEPSSTNNPTNIRKAMTSMVMWVMPLS
jgi:hypothetical protein